MPPALHPRSIFTTSLFTTTLALSFVVVGLPHLIPCPVDSSQYAEGQLNGLDRQSQPSPRRRRRRTEAPEKQNVQDPEIAATRSMPRRPRESSSHASESIDQPSNSPLPRRPRECPVPKPVGLVGQILGFNAQASGQAAKPNVRIKPAEEEQNPDPRHQPKA